VVDLQQFAADWPAISRRLDEALALAPAERDAWLETLREADSIKAKLRQLLSDATAVETDDFLGALPKLTLGPAAAGEGAAAGATVGPYRLLAELGQGGMGAVWLAERIDGQPRRRIALKLPHVGWAPGLAARLARERDILASLEHPNIARLYDAGVDPLGRPYLALEYVDGTPIDRHCAAHSLSLRERLALLLQVAAAVAHAHTRLVVHRDLKPSNILVTEGGGVRLLDFGIAKMLEAEGAGATDLTAATGRVLTPDYASPEQIRNETIGTASDVYSLGVVAYEVLAQVRPYHLARAGAPSLIEAIAEAEPLLASRASPDTAAKRQLKGDLDAILNKVLKKSTAERYPTIEAFAADIERHLRGEPVHARPNAPWYHAERWVRRHKLETAVAVAILVAVPAGAAAQAAVLAALAAGAGVALWQARVARRQAERARAEAVRAEQVKDFALSIFEGANTDSGAGAATSAADMLTAAQARIESELAGHPETAVELMTSIGDGLMGLGRLDDADRVLARAVTLAGRELGADHPRTLGATVVRGSVLVLLDRPDEAKALLAPAVAEARRQNDTHFLVDALRWLSTAQMHVGELDAGLLSARAAVDALSAPNGRLRKADAANAWAGLASALNATDREGLAEAARRALSLAREIHGDRLSERMLGARLMLGKGLAAEGRVAEALDELSAVLADSIRFFGADHWHLQFAANFLGHVRLDSGDVQGAIDAFRTQLAASGSRSETGSDMGMGHFALARALLAAGRNDEALEHFEAGARLHAEAGGPESTYALRSHSGRALALTRLGRLQEAEAAFESLAQAPWTGTDQAAHASRLAELRSQQGRHAEATALARTSCAALQSHTSKTVQARASQTLGAVLLAAGHSGEAIAPLETSVRLYAKHHLGVSADHAEAVVALARARAFAGSAADSS